MLATEALQAAIWTSLIAMPAALLVGVAALITALKGNRGIATNHGKRPGEYLELIHADVAKVGDDVSELRIWFWEHMRDRELHHLAGAQPAPVKRPR